MPSECRDALVSPCRKEEVEALFDILFRSHVKAVCDLLDGACNAVVKLVGIMQARLFTAGDLLPQAHIYAADKFGLLAVVLLKMRSLFILVSGKIGLDLVRDLIVIKDPYIFRRSFLGSGAEERRRLLTVFGGEGGWVPRPKQPFEGGMNLYQKPTPKRG